MGLTMTKFLSLLIVIMTLAGISAAKADEAQGMVQLKEAELAKMCGGFSLGNGVDVNVGIDNSISVNGVLASNAQINLNGNTVSTSSTGATIVQGNGGQTYIVQSALNGTSLIANTANNATISQVRTISVDMTNLSHQALLSMNGFASLQAQALNGLRNGVH